MSNEQRIEAQIIHRPIPANMMECDECFGLWWSDEACERCNGRGMIEARCKDGEHCTCGNCEIHEAQFAWMKDAAKLARDSGCRDCGDNCHCYRGLQS